MGQYDTKILFCFELSAQSTLLRVLSTVISNSTFVLLSGVRYSLSTQPDVHAQKDQTKPFY